MSTDDSGLGGLLILVILAVYLLPGFIASNRQHHQRPAIWALTMLGGWTGLGWLVAFVWACTMVKFPRPRCVHENEGAEETEDIYA